MSRAFWRPCTVAFVPRDPVRRSRLTSVAEWLEGGAGFTTVVRIIYVLVSIFSAAFPGILVYLILWLVMPPPGS